MRTWLKNAREACGLTMKGTAEKLDISESYYSMIESGSRQKTLDISLASKISLLLNIPLQNIVDNEKALQAH